jgi:hypothetical protein
MLYDSKGEKVDFSRVTCSGDVRAKMSQEESAPAKLYREPAMGAIAGQGQLASGGEQAHRAREAKGDRT